MRRHCRRKTRANKLRRVARKRWSLGRMKTARGRIPVESPYYRNLCTSSHPSRHASSPACHERNRLTRPAGHRHGETGMETEQGRLLCVVRTTYPSSRHLRVSLCRDAPLRPQQPRRCGTRKASSAKRPPPERTTFKCCMRRKSRSRFHSAALRSPLPLEGPEVWPGQIRRRLWGNERDARMPKRY